MKAPLYVTEPELYLETFSPAWKSAHRQDVGMLMTKFNPAVLGLILREAVGQWLLNNGRARYVLLDVIFTVLITPGPVPYRWYIRHHLCEREITKP